jgi:type VI secretion system protein ImpC
VRRTIREVHLAKPFDFGGVNLSAGEDDSDARSREEIPFRIVILGDFSGRQNRGQCDAGQISKRRPLQIDRDNFDEVLARLAVELRLPLSESGSIHLQFSALDDFHPDRIFERVAAFSTLRSLRGKVNDPSNFPGVAKEFGLGSSDETATPQTIDQRPVRAPSAMQLASGNLLDDMIEETESRVSHRQLVRASDPVRDFAQHLAEQHAQRALDARQPQLLAVLDRAIGGLMRAILHNPDFQALEAIWRATSFLVRQLDTDSQLKVYLLDISQNELIADLHSTTDARNTGIWRPLVESTVGTPGAEPWALILGCYTIDDQSENREFLARMARIAQRAHAPFIAAASPRLLGCVSLEVAGHLRKWKGVPTWWSELRRLPEAKYVGLVLPRFLLRLPYGKKTSPLESFDFEESSESIPHENYLWGNPAFAIALLLGQSFGKCGRQMRTGTVAEIERLPLHVSTRNGESTAKPCAEVLLTEEMVGAMIEAGLMPLVSFKNRDSVRAARFQSITDPAHPLAGPWQA